MSSVLGPLLKRLDEMLRGQGLPVVDHWAPPAPSGDVAMALQSLGMEPHPDVQTVFSWHNGFIASDDYLSYTITPTGVTPISLNQAIEDGYEQTTAIAECALPGWFPVFEQSGGWTTVDCRPDSPHPGAVRSWIYGEINDVADSLAEVITWFLEFYEQGHWTWRRPGWDGTVPPEILTQRQLSSGLF